MIVQTLLFVLLMLNGTVCFSLGIFEKLRGTKPENDAVTAVTENAGDIKNGTETENDGADVQDQEVAVLLQGPELKKGLPFFPTNAIPGFYGKYEFRGTEISVYYTEGRIVRKESWEIVECGPRTGLAVVPELELRGDRPDGGEVNILLFPAVADGGYSCFFVIPEEMTDFCLFLDRFFIRFNYFIGITRDVSIPPFPAIIPIE